MVRKVTVVEVACGVGCVDGMAHDFVRLIKDYNKDSVLLTNLKYNRELPVLPRLIVIRCSGDSIKKSVINPNMCLRALTTLN